MPDAAKAKSAEPIKNGTATITCTKTGEYSTINTYASPLPTIDSFDSKYVNRLMILVTIMVTVLKAHNIYDQARI